MKYSFAVIALIYGTGARHLVNRNNLQLGVRFAVGADDADVEAYEDNYGNQPNLGVRFVQERSDPIHGSLGPPKIPAADLTPEQQFELKQRNTPKPNLELDPEVGPSTLDSIKIAEGLAGAEMYNPDSPEAKKEIKPTPEYHMADSDDETEDTVETRKSVQWAENNLRSRWFINAQEKRSFEDKVARGEIRPEVLDFKDQSGEDPQASADELATKETNKKAALKEAKEAKEAEEAKKAADKNKSKEELKAEADEAADKAAREAAIKGGAEEDKKMAAQDKAKKDAEGVVKGDSKEAADKKAAEPFVPPELAGLV